MIRCILIDDDNKPRVVLKKALQEYFPEIHIVGEAGAVEQAVELIRAEKPDLIFLDVDLTYGTGFDVLDAFDDPNFAVIFVTAFEHYAIKAIEYSAVGYIVKPLESETFRRTVERTIQRVLSPGIDHERVLVAEKQVNIAPDRHTASFINPLADKIALPSGKGKYLVPVSEILYCEAQSNYTEIHLVHGKPVTVSKTLKEFEEQLLPKGFVRIHRSHLINLLHLREFIREGSSLFVRLQGVPQSLAVARMFQEGLLDRLG